MTREQAKELLPVIKAWADGGAIQVRMGLTWEEVASVGFGYPAECYRIKPERPAEEFWIAYRPYKPYPQILERIFVAEENKDNPYWSENGFKVRKFVEVME